MSKSEAIGASAGFHPLSRAALTLFLPFLLVRCASATVSELPPVSELKSSADSIRSPQVGVTRASIVVSSGCTQPILLLGLRNMTEAPLWVDVEVVLPQPNLECVHRVALGPRRDTTLSCTQTAIEANVDYAVTLVLTSDSSTVASGSRVDGALHFDERDVQAFSDRLMAVVPPQSYKGVAMPDSSMERGTLTVALDGIAYRAKARSLSVSASSIVGVGFPEPAVGQPQSLVVEYSEGGGTRSMRFTPSRPLDLVRIHGSLNCLMRRKAQTK